MKMVLEGEADGGFVREDGTRVVRNTWFVYPKEKIVNEEMKRFICYMQKYHRLK